MDRAHLTCSRCGDPIGVYEPAWWQQPNGSIIDAAYLATIADARASDLQSRFYHRRCLQLAPTAAIGSAADRVNS